jgi:hypothetical protein
MYMCHGCMHTHAQVGDVAKQIHTLTSCRVFKEGYSVIPDWGAWGAEWEGDDEDGEGWDEEEEEEWYEEDEDEDEDEEEGGGNEDENEEQGWQLPTPPFFPFRSPPPTNQSSVRLPPLPLYRPPRVTLTGCLSRWRVGCSRRR